MTVLFDQITHLKRSNIKVFISNYTNGSDLSKAVFYMDDSERSSYRNAGMGLFTLACMVCNNGGRFILRTGCISAIVYRGAEGLPSVNIQTDRPHIDGTAFEITLYQDNLDLLQSTSEDFS